MSGVTVFLIRWYTVFSALDILRCCPLQNGAFAAVWRERGLQGDKVRFHVKQNMGRGREKVRESDRERKREREREGGREREKERKRKRENEKER